LGKLNQGTLEVCWSPFVKSPTHIIDELPRIPEIKQSLILEGVRTGQWIYHGQMLRTRRSSLIATGNYESFGASFSICPALMDRFAIALETTYAGPQTTLAIALGHDTSEKCRSLGLNELCDEALDLLNRTYDATAMRSLSREFKVRLAERGFPVLREEEIEAAREQIYALPLSREATLFLMLFISAQNHCSTTGQKRSSRFGDSSEQRSQCPDDCKFAKSACSYVVNGGSRRIERDLITLARALAWVTGQREVALHHVVTAVPYVVWHRSQFSRGLLGELKSQERSRPLRLEAAARYAAQLEREFSERREVIVETLASIQKGSEDLARGRLELGGKLQLIDELPHWFLVDLCRNADGGVAVGALLGSGD
jgi:MoxR-like ATPase